MKLGKFAKKMNLRPNSIVAVTRTSPLAEPETLEELRRALGETGIPNILLAVVEDLNEISVFEAVYKYDPRVRAVVKRRA